jgi:hypothetical protein
LVAGAGGAGVTGNPLLSVTGTLEAVTEDDDCEDTIALVVLAVVCPGVERLVVTGAGCTWTAAGAKITTLGMEFKDSRVLILVSVRADAVAAACDEPLSCSIVTLTVDVGAKSLLAAVCWTVKKMRQRWQIIGLAV